MVVSTPVEENSQNVPFLERWAAPAVLLAAVDLKQDYHRDHLAVSTPVEENIREHDLRNLTKPASQDIVFIHHICEEI